jgi:hypothetical protein
MSKFAAVPSIFGDTALRLVHIHIHMFIFDYADSFISTASRILPVQTTSSDSKKEYNWYYLVI